ncbi:hypothetical protein ACJX0J_010654, partial [Zea mays]
DMKDFKGNQYLDSSKNGVNLHYSNLNNKIWTFYAKGIAFICLDNSDFGKN